MVGFNGGDDDIGDGELLGLCFWNAYGGEGGLLNDESVNGGCWVRESLLEDV